MVLHKKGKIVIEETGTFEIPTLKKTTRVVKEVEEEFETVKLKKIPSVKPKEGDEDEKPQRVTQTTVFNIEETVTKREDIEISVITRRPAAEVTPRHKVEIVKKPQIFEFKELEEKEPQKSTWARQKLSPKEAIPDEKIAVKKSPKEPKQEEFEPPSVALKKVQRLPVDEMKPEEVKLKPFKKPAVLEELETEKKEKPDRDIAPFQKGEMIPQEVQVKEQKRKPEKAPPEEKEIQAKLTKPADKKKIPERAVEEAKAATEKKKIPTMEQELESVSLKPRSVPLKVAGETERKPSEEKEKIRADDYQLHHGVPDEKPKDQESELKQKTPEIPEALEKKPERTTEVVTIPEEKVRALPPSVKKPQKTPEETKPLQLKKGVISKLKDEKEEVLLKPVEQLKKVQLKKTPSPKVEKPLEAKPISIEKMPGLKKVPKMDSPQGNAEAMTKSLKKASPEKTTTQPEKLDKEKIPLVKEVSPGAVQMKKIATQPEEEVFEEESRVEEKAIQEEEEAWGWELVPQESYESEDWQGEGEEGALEVPGVTRRGEMDGGSTNSCCWVKA